MQHLFRRSQQTHKRMQTIASLCMIVCILLSVFAPLSALAAPNATVFAQGTTDYGDLPDTSASTATGDYQTLAANGGPSHGIAAILRMGAQIDGEADGQPNANADGDDITGIPNDEDGVQFKTPLRPGAKTVVVIGLQQPFNSTVYVNGWIDFNQDGDFTDDGEQIALDQASNNGAVRTDASYKAFDFSIPTDAMSGFTYARFRVCTATGECNTPVGAATDGEVEDYRVQIQSVAQLGNYVWLDKSGDGVQQSGEPGVEGVLVKLYRVSDNTLVDVTATDASGYYSFTSVLPATYYAQFVASSGYTFTTALQGGNPENDSDANQVTGRTGDIVLAGGANDQTWDAGLVTTTDHLVVCEAIPFGPTEVSHMFSLPKFNPALGALTGIDINSYVGLRQWIGGENRAANAQTGRITTSSDAMLTLPDATTLNSAVGLNTGFQSYALYDGITDFSGSSSYSYDDWQYAFSAVSTSYATLADFIAASPGQTVDLPFETLSGFTVSGGGGNLAAAQATYVLAGVCVNYSYIPAAPSTITVIKNSTGGDGTFDFSSPDAALAAVSLTTVGGTATSAVITKIAGTYTITEDALSGWTLTGITVTGESNVNSTVNTGSSQALLNLDAGENITVTFANNKDTTPVPPNSCLAIDEWSDAQLIGNTGGITSSVVSGAGILGGERDMFYTDLTPPNANGIYANVDPAYFLGYPILEIANASGRYSKLTIVWDGADGDATTLDPGGLGGIDLLVGGATAFTATISTDGMPPATPNFPVTLTVYDTIGGVSQLIVSVPPLNSAYAPFSAPFASFTAIAGGGADFAQVGAISMVIDMTATYLNNWDVVLTRFGRDCQAPTTGTITVIKNTVGGEGTFDFSSPDNDLAAVSLTTVGGTAQSTVITKSAGTYTLTEDALAGWQLTNISFSGDTIANSTRDNGNGQAIIRLDAGESITVTYTNAKIDLQTPVTGVLTVTKTIIGNGTGPFNITIDGPSGVVTTTSIDGGETKVITGLVGGIYTVTETSPGAGWTTTYTATTGYSTGSSAVVTLTNSTVTIFGPSQITGTVYNDYNSDGLITANGLITDTGVQSVTVTIYDSLGNLVSTGTDASGLYTVTPSFAGPYRVEFTNLPSDYEPSRVYTGTQNGTSVQFINNAAQASGVNLGLLVPCNYCQDNPRLALPIHKPGNSGASAFNIFSYEAVRTGNGSGIPQVLSATTGVENPVSLATPAQIGTTWGNAYQSSQKRLFATSLLRRHAAMADGPGYVYIIDPVTGYLGEFNLAGVTPSNGGAALNFGSVTRVSSMGADNDVSQQLNRDLDAFAKAGKMAFGDADFDDSGNTLWTVNLFDRMLIAINVSGSTASLNGASAATLSPLVRAYSIATLSGAPSCSGGTLRPWGLGFYLGKGYLGVTCDASTSLSVTDLDAYVLSFDPQNPTAGFTQVITFGLDYNRELAGAFSNNNGDFSTWRAWTDDWNSIKLTARPVPTQTVGTSNVSHHMPLVSDIEFTDDGSLVVGLLDRNGMMLAGSQYEPVSASTTLVTHNAGGDIIRACKLNGAFVLEGTGGCAVNDDGSGTTIQGSYAIPQPTNVITDGPSNQGEFFYQDKWGAAPGHNENSLGSVAIWHGRNEVVGTVYDPLGFNPLINTNPFGLETNGIHHYNASTGQTNDGYLLVERRTGVDKIFSKAGALGDIEILCDPAPIEIGNRVWDDIDNDGVQDAGEPGLAGVQVTLQTPSGSINTTTDINGNYYFTREATTGVYSTTLRPNTNYTITIGTIPSGYSLTLPNAQALAGAGVSSNHAISDVRDSDAALVSNVPTIYYTTGSAGQNNHGLDFGFTKPATGQVDILNTYNPPGTIQVTKQVTTTDGSLPTVAGNFTINVDCNGASVSPSNSGTVGAGSSITFSVAGGATCTVSEELSSLPAAPSGYSWFASQLTLKQVTVSGGMTSTVTALNTLTAIPPSSGVLTLTKTISGTGSGPFTVTVTGPSSYLTTTTIDGGQSKMITGLVSGIYTVTETSPGAGWTTTYTATTGYSTGSSAVVTLTNSITATSLAETQITGRVFRDFNSDGQITANGTITDTGMQSVTVTAYGMSGASCGSTTSGATGFYTLTTAILTCDGPYRIEFTNLPAGYEPSKAGTQNGTSVQFVNSAAQAANVNFGLIDPCDYCQPNPLIVGSRHIFSDTNAVPSLVSILSNPYTTTQEDGTKRPAEFSAVTYGQVGNTWGRTWKRDTKELFSAATSQRGLALGPGGAGAIYKVTGMTTAGAQTASTFATIPNVGTVASNAVRLLANMPKVLDTQMYTDTGKVGLGGLTISDDDRTLYVMNLYDRKVYPVDASSGAVGTSIAITDPGCGVSPFRPWAVKQYRGDLYVGMVCEDASNAYVVKLAGPSFTTQSVVNTTPLNYTRDVVYVRDTCNTAAAAAWKAWTDISPIPAICFGGNSAIVNPTPLLVGLEFADNGDLLMGFMDRFPMQMGAFMPSPFGATSDTPLFAPAGGDILKATKSGSTWGAGSPALYETADNVIDGTSFIAHAETSLGGLAVWPGTNEFVLGVYDPVDDTNTNYDIYNTGGVKVIGQTSGMVLRRYFQHGSDYEATANTTIEAPYLFGRKGNSLGDIELLCDPAPIEIGNRVWWDMDGDGVQDAGEPPLSGVQVSLQTISGTVNTTTDINGNYYFTREATTGSYSTTLRPNTAYTITIGTTPSGYSLTTPNAEALAGASVSSNHAISDVRDSDAALISNIPTIYYTTGTAGQNNHGLDFGFSKPATGNVGITNIAPVQLGNHLWIESDNDGNASTGTVTPVVGQVVTATDGTNIYTATTDDAGLYTITVPANTTYTVTTGLPAGYLDTPTLGGNTGDDPTGNNDKNHDRAGTTVVMTETDNLSIDFGFTPNLVKIGDRLWIEGDNDGIASTGTITPVVGQVVTATDGSKIYTATTDSNGLYTITVPANTTYTVTTGLPAGVQDTPIAGGNNGTNPTGNNDKNHDRASTTVVVTETDNLSIDFGFWQPLSLGNLVWLDTNNNGVVDGLEAGVQGVTVTLSFSGSVVATTTTDASGNYTFTNLVEGDYIVNIPAENFLPGAPLAGYISSSDPVSAADINGNSDDDDNGVGTATTVSSAPVTLTPNSEPTSEDMDPNSNLTVDFGFYIPVSLGNRLFYDTNNDGLDNDGVGSALGSSVGIDGGVVELYYDTNGNGSFDAGDTLVKTTTTSNGGYYTFTSLAPTTSPTSTYLVVITSSNFITGGPLPGYVSSTDIATTLTPDLNDDFDDNGETIGTLGQAGGVVASRAITLTVNGEPTGENNGGNDPTDDNDSNQTLDFGFLRYDFGDLPDGSAGSPDYPTLLVNDGARHLIDPIANPILGVTVDSEFEGQPSGGAGGDDLNGDDEDGVTIPLLEPNTIVTVSVVYSNPTAGNVYINGWIDFNQDGVMGAGEQIITDTVVATGNGTLELPIFVPGTAKPGDVFARFRISSDSGLQMTGAATDGEVEDYIALVPPVDLGDLPEIYGTSKSANGPRHIIDGVTRLDGSVDSEGDGVPGDNANGDNLANLNDEDGVQWPPVFAPNSTAQITVSVVTTDSAFLNAWIDWNGDGDFNDDLERIVVTDTQYVSGTQVIDVSTPAFITDTLYARFRLTDNAGEATEPTGLAASGEVEDYVLMSLGNTVWLDNGQAGGVPDNGILDGGEQGIPGVTVTLYISGSVVGVDQPIATTTTDANGHYYFNGLTPGDYFVHIPSENFDQPGDPLYAMLSSSDTSNTSDPNNNNNETIDENGIDDTDPDLNGISSNPITLSVGDEPTDDGNGANGNLTLDFGFIAYDRGDLPNAYDTLRVDGGASHVVTPDLYFGTTVDAEADGQPTDNADGDDTTGTPDDEDGIVFMTPLMPNTAATISMTAHVTPGLTAYYGALIDFNGDGTFQASEIFTGTIVDGENTLNLTVPGVISDTVYSRFRISTDPDVVAQAINVAPDGEVEDYVLMSLGNQLWFDNGTGTGNNGLLDGGEQPVPAGVTLTLVVSGTTTPIATTTTDSNGNYLFTGLPEGDYQVIIAAENFQSAGLLEGYVGSTGQDAGDDTDDNDNGSDVANPALTGIPSNGVSLRLGDEPTDDGNGNNSNLTVDFGLYKLRVGDLVWNDLDNDGIKDGNEPVLMGVTVTLLSGGSVIAETVTDDSGLYTFTGLISGTYVISVTPPAGYLSSTPTTTDDSGNNTDHGDASGNFIVSQPFDLTPGAGAGTNETNDLANGITVNPNLDFGLWQPLSLGNRVWFDTNNNGTMDGSEVGVESVTLTLLDGSGNPVTSTVTGSPITALTDANGYYTFTDLISGTYQVQVDGDNFLAGAPLADYVNSDFTEANPNADVDEQDNGINSADLAAYLADGVVSGPVLLSAGDEPTGEDHLGATDNSTSSNYTVDFGFYKLSVGDLVWNDLDNDGFKDASEVGLSNVPVALLDNAGKVISTTTTDGSGLYTFTGLISGTYVISVTPPANYVSSTGQEATDGGNNSDHGAPSGDSVVSQPFDLTPGSEPTVNNSTGSTTNPNLDFGLWQPLELGNRVWHDLDNSGDINGNDTGIEGVTLTLLDDSGNPVTSTVTALPITTTTDAGGYYTFTDLISGTYKVQIDAANFQTGGVLQNYLSSTPTEVNPNDDGDSNDNGLNPANAAAYLADGVVSGNVTLSAGDEPTTENDESSTGLADANSNLSVDFGFALWDRGDLPNAATATNSPAYSTTVADGGPSHLIIAGLRIGANEDGEADGQPTATANGDDANGKTPDDEDGVILPAFVAGSDAVVSISVVNTTGVDAYVYGFIDFNGDGSFANNETVVVTVPGDGSVTSVALTFTVPVDADASQLLGARFRISSDDGLDANGPASDGEVEDYLIRVAQYDFGDLPSTLYPTLVVDDGASHAITPDLYFGASVDNEGEGQPTVSADGDDKTDTPDDEDGIVFMTPLMAGESATISMTAYITPGLTAYYGAFIDFNGDGDFADVGEIITGTIVNGQNAINLTVPAVVSDTVYSRFRISTDLAAVSIPTGAAVDGEVEDYALMSLGNQIWFDTGAGTANDGEFDLFERPVPAGVTVTLVVSGTTTPIASTTTDSNGKYLFTGLSEGDYQVIVAAENFQPGGLLEGYVSSAKQDTEDAIDYNDNGEDVADPSASGIPSAVVTLRLGDEPTDDGNGPLSNLTIDFGLVAYDWGDLPDSNATGSPSYDTLDANGGAVHLLIDGLMIGGSEDGEVDGQPNATANGDDSHGMASDDEDGVILPRFIPGQPATVVVNVTNETGETAYVFGFIDFNGNGFLDDSSEIAVSSIDGSGNLLLTFDVPVDADVTQMLGARFRLGLLDDGLASPTGIVLSGEVEDYLIQMQPLLGAIGNYVWLDEDADGQQDAGEPGLANVIVTMVDDNGKTYTTTTDSQGGYLFPDLPKGLYRVTVALENFEPGGALEGMEQTPLFGEDEDLGNKDEAGYVIDLDWGDENLTADFGYNPLPSDDVNGGTGLAALGDRVWIDSNGDGVQDPNEVPVAGVVLTLYSDPDGNGIYDTVVATDTTDANGNYLFDDLPAGAYVVKVTDSATASHDVLSPTEYTQTGDPDHFATTGMNNDNMSKPVILAPGDLFLNVDFGYQPQPAAGLNSVGDTIWFDADADGNGMFQAAIDGGAPITQGNGTVADVTDSGIAGVTVALVKDLNGNGLIDAGEPMIATDMTDSKGQYLFAGLPDGKYIVKVTDTDNVLQGLKPTWDKDSGLISPDEMSAVDLDSAHANAGSVNNRLQDFGYTPEEQQPNTALLGDTIYFDPNKDGVQQPTESGVEGVLLLLTDSNGVTQTTTTDENGHYYFAALDPNGVYTVTVAPENFDPGGVLEGMDNTGDPDSSLDSESVVDFAAGTDGNADPDDIDNNVNLGQDFGYAGNVNGRIGNLVWLDSNADGLFEGEAGPDGILGTDDDEPVIGGVTIDLYRDLNGNGLIDAGEPKLATTVTTDTIGTGTNGTDGNYIFENLPAGSYVVDVTDVNGLLAGYWKSDGANEGDNNNSQSDAYAVTIGGNNPLENLTADFGYYVEPAAVGNYVWVDTNANGIQDDGETGINGVKVTLEIVYPSDEGRIVYVTTVTANDANGNPGWYSFDNLLIDEDQKGGNGEGEPIHMISVSLNQPALAAYSETVVNQGDVKLDSDLHSGVLAEPVQGLTDTSAQDPATNEGTIASYDFGYYIPASLGNYVWLDENADGVQDEGEPGLPNVTVVATNDKGDVFTTTTDSHGGYLFSDLIPGVYTVTIPASNFAPDGALEGMEQTPLNGGNNSPDLGNKDDAGYTVELSSGEENLTADFGYNPLPSADVNNGTGPAALGDRVWIDSDGDGVQDPNEVPVEGAELTLYYDPDGDGVYDTPYEVGGYDATETTDANGNYLFDNLPAGSYVVKVTDSGEASHDVLITGEYTQTGDPDHFAKAGTNNDNMSTTPVVLAPGDLFLNVDFGYQPKPAAGLNSVGDTIWFDADGDGNGPSLVPIDGSAPVTQGAGGTADAVDYGIAGVTVALVKDENSNGIWDSGEPVIATDVTDKKGQYLFEDLPDGRYIVIVNDTDNVLEGLKPSYDEDNGTSNPDEMSSVDLDSAKAVDTSIDNRLQDFGYTPKAQNGESGLLGDTIWFDSNKDGVQNPGESGIEGVVVQLTDMNGNPLATTTTDENGHYYFAGLPLDTQYKVVVAPENFAPGSVLEGMANTGDKEGDKNNTTTSEVLTNAAPIDLTNDLGYAADPRNPIGKVGNLVWLDSNADGVWDGANGPDGIAGNDDDEPLIAGVTLDLYRDLNGNGKIDAGEPKIASTTTTSTSVKTNGDLGNYLFDNLPVIGNGDGDPAAEYVVDVTDVNGVLAGYWHSLGAPDTTNNSQSDADAVEISVGSPENLTADFGYYVEPAAVGNYVWVDVNGDGIQNDGETGINGVAVTLKIVYPNGTTLTVTTVTTDDLSGNPGYYSFGNLLIDEDHNGDGAGSEPVHTISVKLTQPALTGYVPTLINVGDDKLDSDNFAGVVAEPVQGLTDSSAKDPANTEQTIASYDFGFYQPASLGNYVWEDLNKNGIQDEGETGVADVKVELLDSTGKVISTTQTNASGLYTFSNLAPGTYAVKFTTPDGYIITNPNQGDDATDSDANRTTGITQQVTLQSGEHNPTLDAGIYSSLSLGNLVWHDVNNNGQVDSGEQGIPGVTLQLFKEGDDPTTATPLKTTATDVSGNYLFTDLLPGNYFVYIPTPPAKYPASSTPTDTADNGQDNDDNGSQPAFGQPVTSPVVELKTNSEPDSAVDGDGKNGDLTIDFGFFATASLGDLVWFDSDKDGVQDSVETGLPGSVDAVGVPGVLVTLFTADGSKVATTTTDIHGNYLFAGLLPGNYYVEFAPPAGYKISPTDTVTGTDVYDSDGLRTPVTNLSSGEHDPTLDLGLYLDTLPASIGDYVWFDANNNGVQDSGESGIPGVKVTLYHADGTPVASTNSDVNGKYFFAELIPGDYYVQFSAPDGLTPSPANAGSNDAVDSDADAATGKTTVTTLDPGENDPSWDAGFFSPTPLASIGDYVWYDLDADGIQDGGETGVSGVIVKLYDSEGNLVATTTTDSTGHYGFKNLVPGDYSLEFVPNDKYIISDANQGGNDAADSDVDPITGKTAVTTLVAGENDLSWDLGIYVGDVRGVALLPVSLGDRVWNDLNRDGLQDADEPGLAGVTVKLYDSLGQLIATTLTDSNGNYSFNNLPAGDYYVEFVPPVNYLYSPTNAGGNDVADSDMDHGTGRTPITSLPSGSNNPNLDAGFYLPPTADDESNEPEAANKIFLPVISR